MPTRSSKPASQASVVFHVVAALLSAALVVAGAMWFDQAMGKGVLAAGGVAFVAVVLSWGSLAIASGTAGGTSSPDLEELRTMLAEIRGHTMLSDNAKRVLFRDRELELLRNAIEDDIARGEYNAGLTLCNELANLFGYREEAEVFRSRILQVRHEHYEAQLHEAIAQFEGTLASRDWAAAHQLAARMRRLFPEAPYLAELDQRIVQAREEHKRELESQFLQAAHREDVEQAMALLRQLDRYLTPEEAGRLREVAQGVVSKHRENLGVQFKLAVNDHRWPDAARVGRAIITEFPNSKMADEVRGLLEVIQARAGASMSYGAVGT